MIGVKWRKYGVYYILINIYMGYGDRGRESRERGIRGENGG